MERIKTIATRDLTKSVKTGGCGECQTSCQSACKTPAAWLTSSARTATSNFCNPLPPLPGGIFLYNWNGE